MAHPPNNHPRFSKPTLDSTGKTHSTTPTSTIYNLTSHFSTLNQKPTKSHYPFPVKPQKITKQGEMESSKSDNKKSLVIVKDGENEVVRQKVVKMVNVKRGLYCDGQVELVNFLAKSCAKVVSVDMPSILQIHAVGFARKIKDSLEKFNAKTLALSLKKEFDGAYGPAWHCIVGTSFGSFVTHSVGGFLYFSLDQKLYILLFKTTVQRAD